MRAAPAAVVHGLVAPARSAGAHALLPPVTVAQSVPAQQSVAMGSQGAPAATQRSPVLPGLAGVQTRLPSGPAQGPSQQSWSAVQRAPSGAQRS